MVLFAPLRVCAKLQASQLYKQVGGGLGCMGQSRHCSHCCMCLYK